MLETKGIRWDGINYPYLPGESLDIDPGLQLHTDAEEQLDSITYEVLRHNLWNINEEHGATILKVSGSPVALWAHDFNPTLTTETGEQVYNGSYIQVFSGMTDLLVQWILENRSANPGIQDGDMFLSCDPWIAAPHQMDNYILCPVFWEGKLFSWVVSTLHVHEAGGTTPGGFCPDAQDAFWEPTSIPPIKLVENGQLRDDVEDMFVRRSRVRDLTALDIRSQVAGATVAKNRLIELVKRYGPAVLKGVMRKVISDGEKAFSETLGRLPDGTWRDVQYVGTALPGDRNVYRLQLNMTKKGDHLVFDNEGTDPQHGSINCTFAGWRAAIISNLSAMISYDQLYSTGGLINKLEFRPAPGTLTCATYPGGVSMWTSVAVSIPMAARVVGKMLACDPELKRDILTSCGLSNTIWTGFSGVNQSGEVFATVTLDQIAGAIGAFSFRDGVSTGGLYWDPHAAISNCEVLEQQYPFLILYRREVAGGGGNGRWRGGDGIEIGWVTHGVDAMQLESTTSANVIPSSPGLFGGLPGSPGWHYMVKDSPIQEWLSSQRFPGTDKELRELPGEHIDVAPKTREIVQDQNTVWEMRCMSGGGYGDPLRRPPEQVAIDVHDRVLTVEIARQIYGVVMSDNGELDADATRALRQTLIETRLDKSQVQESSTSTPEKLDVGPDALAIHEYLYLAQDGPNWWIGCECGHVLCRSDENYQEHSAIYIGNTTELGPLFEEPSKQVDADIVLRQFYCPSCGVMLESEVVLRSEPLIWDIQIDVSSKQLTTDG